MRTIYGVPLALIGMQEDEGAAVERFTAWINGLGPLSQASLALRRGLLEEVKMVARHVDGSNETGKTSGYDRRVISESAGRWSLAAIILRPGQQTHPHDHGGWGCAVTVQGVECDRRFIYDASGNLVLSSERDYPREQATFSMPRRFTNRSALIRGR